MNLSIQTTFDQFVSEIGQKALNYGAAHYGNHNFTDLPADDQARIKSEYESLDEFFLLSEDDYEQQLEDYGTDYMGEDAKVGDLMWFDGECLCGLSCIYAWYESEAVPEKGKWHDWTDVLESVKWAVVLREFERLNAELANEVTNP